MALKEHINLLIEDMKKLDSLPEEDLREYARLVSAVESQKGKIAVLRAQVWEFERVFGMLADEATYREDSGHFITLESDIAREKEELQKYQDEIDAKKEYFSALSTKESERLWKREDEAGQIAAIYCAFSGTTRSVADRVKFFIDAKAVIAEPVAKYLAGKAILSSEQEKVSDEERKKLDELLISLLQNISHSSEEGTWKRIESVLKIRNIQRILPECEKLLAKYKQQEAEFERFVTAYKETKDRIHKQYKNLYDGVTIGKNVSEVAGNAEKTYRSSRKEMQDAVDERENQQGKIERGISALEGMQKKLQKSLENGLDINESKRLAEEICTLQSQLETYMAVSSLEQKQSKWLNAFNRMVSDIHAASERDAAAVREKEQDMARKRVERRERRQRKRRNNRFRRIVAMLLFVLVVPDALAHAWAYAQPMWEVDEEGVLRVNGSDVHWLTTEIEVSQIYPGILYLLADTQNYLEEVTTFHNSLKIATLLEKTGGVLELPDEVDGVKPTGLYLVAEDDMPISEMKLPDSINKIERAYIPSLQVMNLGNVEEIADSALRNYSSYPEECTPLAEVDLSSLKVLGNSAFYGNPNVDIVIATQLEEVSSRAFAECNMLVAAELPAAKVVREYAFKDCINLTSVNVFSAEVIEQGAFSGCVSLKEIKLFAAKTISADAFGAGDTTSGGKYVYPAVEELYLPAIENIYSGAFGRVYSLRKVYLGGNLQHVSANAFPTENQQYEFILNSNASYSEEVMESLRAYGVPISYMDFNTLSF